MYAIHHSPQTGVYHIALNPGMAPRQRQGMVAGPAAMAPVRHGYVGADQSSDVQGACAMFKVQGKQDGGNPAVLDAAKAFEDYSKQLIAAGFVSDISMDQARGCYMEGFVQGRTVWKDPTFWKGGAGGLLVGAIAGIAGTLLVTKVIL